MKRILIFFISLTLLGCATGQALDQPDKKDLSVLDVGTDRELVLLELGAPAASMEEDGYDVDLFSFVQGYSAVARTSRATGHMVAEMATLGLWGLIGTPIEQAFNGTILGYKVWYEDGRVLRAEQLVEKPVN